MPYDDLLRGRWSWASCAYLITAVTKSRMPLFATFSLGAVVAAELARTHTSGAWRLLAWVVMPDHIHLLVELRGGSLPQTVRAFKGRTAMRINAIRGSRGSVWQRGYHDHAIRREEVLIDAARYVVANPLRAGLVRQLRDYPFWDSVYLCASPAG
jgi:REP element-mobilizing transposase RayT